MKKNLLVILIILLIPLTIVALYIFKIVDFENQGIIENQKIIEKPISINDYEMTIFDEISAYTSGQPLEYPLKDYEVFPYIIIWKDTLSKIAYKFNLTKDEIAILVYLNKIKNKNLIIAGQTLLIAKKKNKNEK